jgi:Ferredoxin-thioredoxin reductase, catalytic subunit
VFELVPESGGGKLTILSDYKPLGLSRKLLHNPPNFTVVVCVDDFCEPCDSVLKALVEVNYFNPQIKFKVINTSYEKPNFLVWRTPLIFLQGNHPLLTLVRVSASFNDVKLDTKLIEEIIISGYILTHKYTKQLLKNIVEHSKKNKLYLNKHSVVRRIIFGLLQNYDKYGYPLCVCKFREENMEPDKVSHILTCPCQASVSEVRSRGSCYCGLYISENKKVDKNLIRTLKILKLYSQIRETMETLDSEDIEELTIVLSLNKPITAIAMDELIDMIMYESFNIENE